MKHDEDKIMALDDHKLLAANGENGDRVQFCEFIQKNMNLFRFKNDRSLSTESAGHFIRSELAEALRRNPYQTNLLLGGYDVTEQQPSLYFIDYLASIQKVPYAAHGYGAYFALSIMDKYCRPLQQEQKLTPEAALEVMKKCIEEVRRRLVVNSPSFIIKLVDKNGIKVL